MTSIWLAPSISKLAGIPDEAFRKSLVFPFVAFLAEDDAGRSLFDEVHDGQEQAVRDWIAAFFGDRLQAPRAPEIVDVVTEVQLPANREGLRGPDLLISSAVSRSAQILDQGATLMIAKDAAGHPVLLMFALPGEVARFSPRSTALALVMLTLGGPRNADAFIDLAGRVTAQQVRELGLRQSHRGGGLLPRPAVGLDDSVDLGRKLGLSKHLVGIGNIQIGIDVGAAEFELDHPMESTGTERS